LIDLGWTEGFVRSISDYVFVRERDEMLILMPNQAYKLNPTGLRILSAMLGGKGIYEVLSAILPPGRHLDEGIARDVHEFFCDLRALVMGCLREGSGRRAIETVPYTRPYNLLPVLSEIAVTYRCNLSCRFCYAGCTCRSSTSVDEGAGVCSKWPSEMTLEEIRRVLQVIRHDAQVPSVSLTGGEPALRTDLPDIVQAAKEIGLRVNLITNGTLISDALADELKAAGLASAQVSLEGGTAQVHDELTGHPGSFKRTLDGIERLRAAGFHVHTNTTINRINKESLEELVDLIGSLALPRFSMNMIMPCGSADSRTTISYTETAEIVRRVRRKARQAGIEFLWYSPTPYCILNPIAIGLGSKACAACDGLLSIAPNGDVLPCSSLPEPVGNLLTQEFEGVWNSPKALYYRERRYASDVCRSCDAFEICAGACPIYFDAFGYSELAPEGVKSLARTN